VREDAGIRPASQRDAEEVGLMISKLLCELYPNLADQYGPEATIATARRLLDDSAYTALLANAPGGAIGGVVGLNECKAIYAHGAFGEIAELYVEPDFRSEGVGGRLIDAAVTLGESRGWSMIEVGAPDVPRWQRTVDFYIRRGFVEVGPRLYRELSAA
jgi:GNAT superfamily N-acetyltransferase